VVVTNLRIDCKMRVRRPASRSRVLAIRHHIGLLLSMHANCYFRASHLKSWHCHYIQWLHFPREQ